MGSNSRWSIGVSWSHLCVCFESAATYGTTSSENNLVTEQTALDQANQRKPTMKHFFSSKMEE